VTSPGQKETANARKHEEVVERRTRDQFEASRVLQIKRWEVQHGPFRGFGSPPGRF